MSPSSTHHDPILATRHTIQLRRRRPFRRYVLMSSQLYSRLYPCLGHRYKIIQPHRSQVSDLLSDYIVLLTRPPRQSDWPPSATPALWGRLQDEDNSCQPQQPFLPPSSPPYPGAPQYGSSGNSINVSNKPSMADSDQIKVHILLRSHPTMDMSNTARKNIFGKIRKP